MKEKSTSNKLPVTKTEDKVWFLVFRKGVPYRQVKETTAGKACDLVRAHDSQAGEFLTVESYAAAQGIGD